jgi:hypothetical protein
MIDHISIAVSDLERATRFYEAVLGTLGMAKVRAWPAAVGFGKTYPEFWINHRPNMVPVADDSGVHICFFGANTCYWRVRFEPDPVTLEPDAVIVCYKTAQSGPADPSGHATSSWRDSTSVNTPENALIGVQYIGDHDSFFFPWRVSAEFAQHRLYRNTGLEYLPPGAYIMQASAPSLVLRQPAKISLKAGVQTLNLLLTVEGEKQQVTIEENAEHLAKGRRRFCGPFDTSSVPSGLQASPGDANVTR